MTLPNNSGVVTFKYDPFGRRIQKATGSATTLYVYDGANFVAEYDEAGVLLAKYAQGAGIDEPLALWRGGQVGYYDADGLGSVTSVIDSTLTPLATYSYDAFGKKIITGGNLTNPFQYTGREWDQETGLYYYRARYYDPSTGSFLSEDPIGFGGGSSAYAFVHNNPLGRWDPFGETDISFDVKFKKLNLNDIAIFDLGRTYPHIAFDANCVCAGDGRYQLKVKLKFTFTITYYFAFTEMHEFEHYMLAHDYITKNKSHWDQFEKTFDSKENCETYRSRLLNGAAPNFLTDLEEFWQGLNDAENGIESPIDRAGRAR